MLTASTQSQIERTRYGSFYLGLQIRRWRQWPRKTEGETVEALELQSHIFRWAVKDKDETNPKGFSFSFTLSVFNPYIGIIQDLNYRVRRTWSLVLLEGKTQVHFWFLLICLKTAGTSEGDGVKQETNRHLLGWSQPVPLTPPPSHALSSANGNMFHLVSLPESWDVSVETQFRRRQALEAPAFACVTLSLSPSLIPTQFLRRSMTHESIKVYLVAATEIPLIDGQSCAHFSFYFTSSQFDLPRKENTNKQTAP